MVDFVDLFSSLVFLDYIRFKKLKIKIRKREKEKKKKKEKSTELQKPNVEAEVYNNNKKCD